ncbi:MAG: valine--tRNA ligase [Acidobacteriaceae bacterium]|nr:valine--tRNA ligase [Acidobacteriaceae bacterium]
MSHEKNSKSPAQSPAESSASNLPKAYDPSIIERRWAEYWVAEKLFAVPSPAAESGAAAPQDTGENRSAAFTQLLPPPNVTGRLHMGHMLNQTEMDILTRWHRMRGQRSLWVPGTDHAGIATQMMVERQLASEGSSRKQLGRDAFTDRVWEWKRQYGSAITDQMRRLGASVDWSREYFTMDDHLNVAVKESFVRLYEQGLIYRGSYIVNWDPIQQTAVSDLEVVHEERLGKLYHISYPFADGSGEIVVATTRPETMLGDTAVAVNPTDPRYTAMIGKLIALPLSGVSGSANREIPVLADDWAQPEFGTGAVKVTPAHDPNDFAIGQRHGLASITILDTSAHIDLPGSPYHGLDRFAAREKIVADLQAAGLLVDIKDHNHAVALSQRSGAVIEPRLSMQWFLAVNKAPAAGGDSIAAKAVAAVREGHIKFTPEMYSKTYFEWMNNIHDWCISRQLWWGHRIPAWHCADCRALTVSRETPTACSTCGSANITQETDVLDTWFSSGLLPFTVFGWPGATNATLLSSRSEAEGSASTLTPDLAAFYPTSVLVTGFDILFFWVARMIMLGTHFMLDVPMADGSPRTLAEAVPFREVYIHALVRDADRQKMSKTKGNVIDPIEIIERFGTDAVRFTLASMASPGTDIAFSEARTEGNRAFANKIWNAARFLFMNVERAKEAGIEVILPTHESIMNPATDSGAPSIAVSPRWVGSTTDALESRWILSRLNAVSAEVHRALDDYRFDEAASAIYQFFWGDLCDWYLEIVKLRLNFEPTNDLPFPTCEDAEESVAQTTSALTTFIAVFESALRLLSPFMPFLTEEIWHALYAGLPPAKSIALTRYPQPEDYVCDQAALTEMQTLQELITILRGLRKELGVPDKESAPILIHGDEQTLNAIQWNQDILAKLARVSDIKVSDVALTGNNARGTATFDVAVVYERQIDIPAERERLTKDLAKYEKGLVAAERQLSNEAFMAKAPAHIVEGLRKQAAETRTLHDKTKAALEALPENN